MEGQKRNHALSAKSMKCQSTAELDKIIRLKPRVALKRLTESEIRLWKKERVYELSDDVVACKIPKLEVMEDSGPVLVNFEMEPILETFRDTNYVDERSLIIETQQNEIFALKEALINRESLFNTELEDIKKAHIIEVECLGESLSQLKEINQKGELHRTMMLEANEKLTKIATEKNLLSEELKAAKKERECFLNQIKTFHIIRQDEIRKLTDERCEAMDNMSRIHNSEMRALKNLHECKTEKDYLSYIDEIGNLKEKIEQLKHALANQEKIFLDKSDQLNESHREILNRHIEDNKQLQQRVQALEATSQENAKAYDHGIELLIKSRHNLKQLHETDRIDWNKAKETALKKNEKQNGERIKDIQAEYSKIIRKLEDKLDDKRDDCEEMRKELAQKDAQMKILKENHIRNFTKLKLESAKSIETNNSRIKNLEKINHLLQSEKTVLIGELGKLRAEQIQLVGKRGIAENENNAPVVEMYNNLMLKTEILNLNRKLEMATKVSEMRENTANGQIHKLNEELISIRSKHNEMIRDVEIAETEKVSVAEANKFLIEANNNLSSELNKLKEEHSLLIPKFNMLDSVMDTIAEQNKSLVEEQLSNHNQRLEQKTKDAKLPELKLSQELTLDRSKYSQLLQEFKNVEKEGNADVEHKSSIEEHLLAEISTLKQSLEQKTKDAEICEKRKQATNCQIDLLNNEIVSTYTKLAQQTALDQTCHVCRKQSFYVRRFCSSACHQIFCWSTSVGARLPHRF